jgi:hypothetical protein
VLHRDIKPSNLLLDTQGVAWIADFGLAKAVDQENLTHSGDILGTLRYMAPESLHGRADARADIYALGLTLYELLACRPAFEEKNKKALVSQILNGSPPVLATIVHGLPRDLQTIVHKCIDREPHRRYQTAADLADDLQAFVQSEPIKARPVSLLERGWRWCRRNPGLAASIAAAVLALVLGSVISTGFGIQASLSASQARKAEHQAGLKAAEAHANALRALDLKGQAEEARKLAEEKEDLADRARKKAEWIAYLAQITLAHREWEAGDVVRARTVLANCQEDLRGWEWDYLHNLFYQEQLTSASLLLPTMTP